MGDVVAPRHLSHYIDQRANRRNAKYVFALTPVWHGVAVIFASMAVGINSYLLSARYKTGVATVAGAVTLSTALSLFTVSFWLFVLGIG